MRVAEWWWRTGDRGQVNREHTGGVAGGPAQYVLGVRHRVVVAQERGHDLRRVAQVEPTATQVAGCGQRGVEQVLRVSHTVVIAVGGVPSPSAGQELHWPHRAGVRDAIADAALDDDLVAWQGAVQRWAVDRLDRGAARVGGAAVCVHRLDAPNPGQQVPTDATARGGSGHLQLGVAVGGQCHGRNAKRTRRIHDHRWWWSRYGSYRHAEAGRRALHGDDDRTGQVYAGRGDRGHRGDNGVHRRGSPGEYRSRAADRTGEYQRGNRCHAECRRPR
ncbi:Uncharacterised protein [Mycobacterium tuberculosis]|uniref:Uncharacterized protein n=1 Tax=Mycobacterium tuberculosis TaxID=1773 RepID=A0A654ZT21_MYCTX|nr:Uncharacterised protein [Mycobacterium tuberculosis]CKR46912.1 Uncharacterised protein [Mycobacterium tuberculosis]CNU12365.1 Uncharacterised protein [Mycobacterium tuberculosis]CNU17424.1 Uncharacterised protein [Mycobacterium tuberculosis]CNU18130.1 Uncharacterised protein [Mycobacterium tuberculosis]